MSKRPASSLEAAEEQASGKRLWQNGPETQGDAGVQDGDGGRTQPPVKLNPYDSMPALADIAPWKSCEISCQLPPLPRILDPDLEKTAFTHPGISRRGESYERLEWFGDAYIELAATGMIFKTFGGLSPGRCSQLRELLVRNTTLAGYFRRYGMSSRAMLPPGFGEGGDLGRGRSSDKDLCKTQADMFEAYFGAVIIADPKDGKAKALSWIRELWGQTIKDQIVKYERAHPVEAPAATPAAGTEGAQAMANLNPKDRLRATIGAKGIALSYEDMAGNKRDKDHGLPLYTVGVYLDGWGETHLLLGTGTALQKKEAAHKAAAQALENKKLMKKYEAKKKAFKEALAAAQENEGAQG